MYERIQVLTKEIQSDLCPKYLCYCVSALSCSYHRNAVEDELWLGRKGQLTGMEGMFEEQQLRLWMSLALYAQ